MQTGLASDVERSDLLIRLKVRCIFTTAVQNLQ